MEKFPLVISRDDSLTFEIGDQTLYHQINAIHICYNYMLSSYAACFSHTHTHAYVLSPSTPTIDLERESIGKAPFRLCEILVSCELSHQPMDGTQHQNQKAVANITLAYRSLGSGAMLFPRREK